MTKPTFTGRSAALIFVGIAAGFGALYLLFIAAFPYFYAESGSARYAREHRGEAFVEVVAAAALLWLAWQCVRRAMLPRTRWTVVAVLAVLWGAQALRDYTRTPEHVKHVGGPWYVVAVPQPREIDTIYFSVYYKRPLHFTLTESLVGEYKFVPPDCLVYRGLKVVGRPILAMCGYRAPVETYDTLSAESDLLQRARTQPRYNGRSPL
ncbi:MAG: hypothetical protein V4550_12155 [Gemmatimonadota bacterium]